jgi:hypothetical protein
VAGSGRRLVATTLAGAVVLGGLSGCVSTQEKNARAKLVADRTIDGRRPLRIQARSRDVAVVDVAIVRGRRGGAVVVSLRNRGLRALTDVPIAVGVRDAHGRRVRLNGGRGLEWFGTHVPAIGARETTSWVFVPRRRRALPAGRPWAVAGRARAVSAVPLVAAQPADPSGGRAVRVAIVNRSDVPQYGLQVYAVARAHGRVVAAGIATVRHLGSHGSANARIPLVGAPGNHALRVHAPATIFE